MSGSGVLLIRQHPETQVVGEHEAVFLRMQARARNSGTMPRAQSQEPLPQR